MPIKQGNKILLENGDVVQSDMVEWEVSADGTLLIEPDSTNQVLSFWDDETMERYCVYRVDGRYVADMMKKL